MASPPFAPELPAFYIPRRSRWKEYGRPALLLVVTAACVFLHGALSVDSLGFMRFTAWKDGLLLVAGAFSIMLAHEMGHYIAARYYGVDVTLPHFIPAPPIFLGFSVQPVLIGLIGTFGAFIRIRGPIPHRKALFDIGVAGPLAGFVVTLIVLALGASDLRYVPASSDGLQLASPLLFVLADHLFQTPPDPPGMVRLAGPLFTAAWFGTFLTALNLMPVGQLDGGHAVYGLLRRRAAWIYRLGILGCLCLLYVSPTWMLWTVLLLLFGRQHPTTLDDETPAGRGRAWVGVVTLVVFVLCFMPQPIQISWREFLSVFGLTSP